ncbi:hypothetical protein [Staphylococcus sp. HMSC036D05]|nr:hypothetical protein [Staphylococcus sp. HMSC036D05]
MSSENKKEQKKRKNCWLWYIWDTIFDVIFYSIIGVVRLIKHWI